jgi:beta-1,4-N-acetylglucosaminyltransferase
MKTCLICSAGGHLKEIEQLIPILNKNFYVITIKREDTEAIQKRFKTYFITDLKRNPIKFIKNLRESLKILKLENPDIIISTGAGTAIPTMILSKLFKKKIIFIESFCRIKSPSLSGRIAYHISDLFLVQWKELLKHYGKKAKYWGAVI